MASFEIEPSLFLLFVKNAIGKPSLFWILVEKYLS
jgi:hypothetical protein